MAIYILNAKSINMNEGVSTMTVDIPIDVCTAREIVASVEEVASFIGHPDTARVVSTLLDKEVPANRGNFGWSMLGPNDRVVVAQYIGPRLPEGATRLPEGASVSFWEVKAFRKEEIIKLINGFTWCEPGMTDNIWRGDPLLMVEDWFK